MNKCQVKSLPKFIKSFGCHINFDRSSTTTRVQIPVKKATVTVDAHRTRVSSHRLRNICIFLFTMTALHPTHQISYSKSRNFEKRNIFLSVSTKTLSSEVHAVTERTSTVCGLRIYEIITVRQKRTFYNVRGFFKYLCVDFIFYFVFI